MRNFMIRKVIIPILAIAFALTSCADPEAGSGVPEFFREVAIVSAGDIHTVALKTDGTLWAWGDNRYGQLGDNTIENRNGPVQVKQLEGITIMTFEGVKAVSAGEYHTVAIKTDGSLWACGYNNYGQLGDGTTTQRNISVQVKENASVSFEDVKAVFAGGSHTVAIKNNGTLWAWGSNSYGQLGDGTTTNRSYPVQIKPDTTWKTASAAHSSYGRGHTEAITYNGELYTWGSGSSGPLATGSISPVRVNSDTDWGSVSAGDTHIAAIKTDGSLWTWGSSYQLGDGTKTSRNNPVKVGDNWKAVSAGRSHTAAIKNDDVLWAWGSNEYGQLGNATMRDKLTPSRVILSNW